MYKYIIATGLLCIKGLAISQSSPPELEWSGAQPQWTYISEDPYFIKEPTDPYSSKYSHKFLVEQALFENHLYILEATFSQSPDFGPDGCLLHKLDLKKGNPEFIYYTGLHKGEQYRESFLNSRMRYHPDSKEIELTGFRDFEPRGKPSIFGFYGYPLARRIDAQSGEVKETIIISDTTIRQYIASTLQVIPVFTEDFVYFYFRNHIENDTLKQDLVFMPMDKNGSVLSSTGYKITTSSGLRTQLFQFNMTPLIQKVNDSTLVVISQVINPADPGGQRLISDMRIIRLRENITPVVTQTINILPLHARTVDDYNSLYMQTLDGHIILHNNIEINSAVQAPQSYPLWLKLIDDSGNIKAEVNRLYKGDQSYFFVLPLAVKENKLSVLAIGEKGSYRIMDILEVLPGKEQFVHIANLSLHQEGEELIKIQKAGIYKDVLYIGARLESKVPFSTFGTFHYHYGFDARELGLTSSVSDLIPDFNVQVYPNPVCDLVTISFNPDYKPEPVIAECTDITGNIIFSQKIHSNEFQWDMSTLPRGTYFVRLSAGHARQQTVRVVKI